MDTSLIVTTASLALQLTESPNVKKVCRRIGKTVKDLLAEHRDRGGDDVVMGDLLVGTARANTETLRELFYQILKDELESPGSISRRVAEDVKSMDSTEAILFFKICPFVIKQRDDEGWSSYALYRNLFVPEPISVEERIVLCEARLLDNPRRALVRRELMDVPPGKAFRLGPVAYWNPTDKLVKLDFHRTVRCDHLTGSGKALFDVLDIAQHPSVYDQLRSLLLECDSNLKTACVPNEEGQNLNIQQVEWS